MASRTTSSMTHATPCATTLAMTLAIKAPGRRPFPIRTAFELLNALGFFSRSFDRRKPVRAMNGARRSTARLERVILVGRFHAFLPGAVEFLQHLLGRRPSAVDDAVQRLQMAGLGA